MQLTVTCLWLFFVTVARSADVSSPAQWLNPPNSIGPTTDYSTNPVYIVGETTELHWTTVYTNYSIALWQEDRSGSWAKLGPIIYQTFTASNDLFNWSVSSFQFNLSESNVFFLWLYPGASTKQGSDEPTEFKLSYYHINNFNNVYNDLFHFGEPSHICGDVDIDVIIVIVRNIRVCRGLTSH
ncbi:hypothetical protein DL546_007401 [Coniochaeta pulveracea]|uniref:Uncharacterized protein n=1 Tax=Coniochaeta pulveracea TaxID=177199 RepID=A0A420Y9Q5_9PEZI|nr:hypothetical protein DL546_007401 [Coniochaeta pulveracea]